MAKVYAALIQKGAICPKTGRPYTIDDVPERLKEQVTALLGEEE